MVGNADQVIDIGCDHGYLGLYLLQNEQVNHVTFVDSSCQSLSYARNKIHHQILSNNQHQRATFFVSDGFGAINPNQKFTTVVISGLGAAKIISILRNKKNDIHYGVFGPQNNTHSLREFFSDQQIEIIDEKLVFERGHFYEFIKVDFGKKLIHPYTELEQLLGPILVRKRDQLFIDYLKAKLHFLKDKKINFSLSRQAQLIADFLQFD